MEKFLLQQPPVDFDLQDFGPVPLDASFGQPSDSDLLAADDRGDPRHLLPQLCIVKHQLRPGGLLQLFKRCRGNFTLFLTSDALNQFSPERFHIPVGDLDRGQVIFALENKKLVGHRNNA